MHFSAILNVVAAFAIIPILVWAITMLHLRARRLSTLLAAVGAWILLVGTLSTALLVLHANYTKAYASLEAAEAANLYFSISGIVAYAGMAVFAIGLLWFAVQHPKSNGTRNAT